MDEVKPTRESDNDALSSTEHITCLITNTELLSAVIKMNRYRASSSNIWTLYLTLCVEVGCIWQAKFVKLCPHPLTLTIHSPTKSNKGRWRKCAKSDYVIEAGLIWERNRCPGSETRVACHGWTVHCGAGGPRFGTQGEPPFFDPSLSEEIV